MTSPKHVVGGEQISVATAAALSRCQAGIIRLTFLAVCRILLVYHAVYQREKVDLQ